MVARLLPGPHRKRPPTVYDYRRVFHNVDRAAIGCLDVWEVHGGRETYQIALEQVAGGWQRWHCTCPHAVYRAEPLGRVCKHVTALIADVRPTPEVASTSGVGLRS